ncbi:Protein O-linked-mannose beta-1,4-N-acetylglucosaminyltransferase 2 [Bulinus truncatus]|nr:Protein O-linked-mannose beta-1,4-N-acetylglucosaminyltransferase 2 [Bulinus truncatus]
MLIIDEADRVCIMTYMHWIIHCSMLMVILFLGSLYTQLRSQLDAALDCYKTSQCEAIISKDYSQLFISKTASHQVLASQQLNIETQEIDGSYYDTKSSHLVAYSISISESYFESSQVELETAEKVTVNELKNSNIHSSQILQNFEGSTTNIHNLPLFSEVIVTSQVSLNDPFQGFSNSEQSDVFSPSKKNHIMLQSSMTIESDKKDLTYDHPKYLEFDETLIMSSITESLDVLLINTHFNSSLMSVHETSESIKSTQTLPSITHVKHNVATSVKVLEIEESQIVDSTTLPSEDKDNFCMNDNCGNLNDGVLSIEDTEYRANDRNVEFTFHHNYLIDTEVEGNTEEQKAVRYLKIDESAKERDLNLLISQGTSVFCEDNLSKGKYCHFHNLCYKKKEKDFIFAQGGTSLIESTPFMDYTNIFTMNLSTVPGHNAHLLSLVSIPAESLRKFSIAIVDKTTFIMSRFKPDNIMHVLHDDILPLFNTLHGLRLQHFNEKPDISLIFADIFNFGDFVNLYSLLSAFHPILLQKLNTSVDVICFSDAYIGLSSSTLWYQYGFFKPQGPLMVTGYNVLHNVRRATEYFSTHLKNECILCRNKNYLVLLSRKDNRFILNEGELIMSLARSTKLKIMSVSLEMQSLYEIISIVKNSKGIVGMHGSLLSLLIFLQPGSVVIELFPFGINPSKYTPFQTFCQLPGSGIVYSSWTNTHQQKSVGHPDWPAELGGVKHLPPHVQERILNESEVPDHLCCSDPSWLYHIYQDTEVDIAVVSSLTLKSLSQAASVTSTNKSSAASFQYFPGPVKNISCIPTSYNNFPGYLITWSLPWNLEMIPYTLLESQIVYQEKSSNETMQVSLEITVLSYILQTIEDSKQKEYSVWIRVVADYNITGPYNYVACYS